MQTQVDQAVNMILNLRVLGLEHFLLITKTAELCRMLAAIIPDMGGCVWTSLPVPQLGGSFEMWTMRKHYLGVMAGACHVCNDEGSSVPAKRVAETSTAALSRFPPNRAVFCVRRIVVVV